jgi:two-component sensor histidine kinase
MARIRKGAVEERERLLAELQTERTRLTELFMQAPAFIAVLRGPEHIFERVNPTYQKLTGNRDVIGKRARDAFPDIEGQGFFEILDEVYQTGKPFIGSDVRFLFQEDAENSPREKYVDLLYQPLVETDGSISGIFVHGIDQTERKRAELDIRERAHEIAGLNARLRRAMTETHHRVKNNLQLMSGLIDMQQLGGQESVPIAELARLGANVQALGVIHDILTQESRAGNEHETLCVKELLERLIGILAQTAGDRLLTYQLDEARLTGQQATTVAIVTNELVSNALKHGRGEIRVIFSVDSAFATLEVCDAGPGFREGFDLETVGSTGLDLVKTTVEWDLSGCITCENLPTGGARFAVTFPISPVHK